MSIKGIMKLKSWENRTDKPFSKSVSVFLYFDCTNILEKGRKHFSCGVFFLTEKNTTNTF